MDTSDLKDSIKARLYDFKYTPFLASYTFFWLYYNAKVILIFLSSKLSVQDKINMLAYDNVNLTTPLLYALLYTLIFPFFTLGFYYVTLWYKKNMSKIKQKMEDETPLTQEEANNIKKENLKLRLEIDENIIQLDLSKKRYEDKIDKLAELETTLNSNLEVKEKELIKLYDKKVDENISKLEDEINTINILVTDKNTLIDNQTKNIDDLKKKLKVFEDKEKNTAKFALGKGISEAYQPAISVGSTMKDINNIVPKVGGVQNKIKKEYDDLENKVQNNTNFKYILQIFNDNDTTLNLSVIKDKMKNDYDISKPKTAEIINSLIDLKILEEVKYTSNLTLTKDGLKITNNLHSN
jgi:hypothetical protein